jgi:hypothetical protein
MTDLTPDGSTAGVRTIPTGTAAPSFHDAWIAALDALELDVSTAEALLRDRSLPAPEPWTPPTLHGPLPQDLAPRARMLLDRQLRVSREIATAMLSAGREQRLAGQLLQPAGPPGPAYLDIQA